MQLTIENLLQKEKEGTLEGYYTADQISDDIYHDARCPGISQSGLKLIAENPEEYFEQYIKGNKKKPTKALTDGKVIHQYFLEQDKFKALHTTDTFAIEAALKEKPDLVKPTASKAYKEAIEKFKLLNPKAEIIKQEDLEVLEGIKSQLDSSEYPKQLLTGGKSELTFFWKDQKTGLMCKSRPDLTFFETGKITELKSIEDITKIAGNSNSLKYDIKCAWDSFIVSQILKKEFKTTLLFIQKAAPYYIRPVEFDVEDLFFAECLCRKYLDKAYDHITNNRWKEAQETTTIIKTKTYRRWELEEDTNSIYEPMLSNNVDIYKPLGTEESLNNHLEF